MSTEENVAQAPFDDARADLILRSEGEGPVLFRVYKSTLAVASPVFADMIGPPSSGEIQVIDVPENSKALDLALRHIYPVPSPEVPQLHQVHLLAEFARKYQVDALEQDVKRYLMDAIGRDPIGVFAIAVTCKYKAIGEQAARSSLNVDFSNLKSPFMKYAPMKLYWDLLQYHVQCGKAASAVTSSRTWFSSSSLGQNNTFFTGDGCTACVMKDFKAPAAKPYRCAQALRPSEQLLTPIRQLYGPRCLWNYLHRSAIVLAHCPTPNAITVETFVFEQFDCTFCSSYTRHDLLAFSKIFGTEVQRAIAEVGGSLAPLCCWTQLNNVCAYLAGSVT
jgi:hypothetical protein